MSELYSSVNFNFGKLFEPTNLMKGVKPRRKRTNNWPNQKQRPASEVDLLKDKARSLEQSSSKNYIETSGLPVTANEDLFDVMKCDQVDRK